MVEIFMPKAGMDMKEGTLIRWLKEVGDPVELDEPVMEIETDKITMEAEAPGSGILLSKIVEEGSVVPVLSVLGYIGEAGEKVPAEAPAVLNFESPAGGKRDNPEGGEGKQESLAGEGSQESLAGEGSQESLAGEGKQDNQEGGEGSPQSHKAGQEKPGEAGTAPESGSIPATPYARKLAAERQTDLSQAARSKDGAVHGTDVLATPLAKRIAEDKQISLEEIKGTGYHGKVTKEDVTRQAGAAPAVPAGKTAEGSGNPFRTVESRQQLKGVRKVVGKRMFESYSQVPTVMQSMKVDMTELTAFRRKVNEGREQKISLNDFIIKATAIAVKELPHVRTMVQGEELVTYAEANIGFAVAVEEGLYVPVIKNADLLSIGEISRQAKELAVKARNGTIRPDEYSGGTFSVSNMGMFDVFTFNPIINQPESGILGITGMEDVLKMADGKVVVRKEAVLCMSYDHRVMDGVGSARLKRRVKELIEHPMEILTR